MSWIQNVDTMRLLRAEEGEIRHNRLGMQRLQDVVMRKQKHVARSAAQLRGRGPDVARVCESLKREDWESWFALSVLSHRRAFPRAYLRPLVDKAIKLGSQGGGGRIMTLACEAYGPNNVHALLFEAASAGTLSEHTYRFLLYYVGCARPKYCAPSDKTVDGREVIDAIRSHPAPPIDDPEAILGRW